MRQQIAGQPVTATRYHGAPRGAFTDSEVARSGSLKRQARSAGLVVRTVVAQLPSSLRGRIHKAGNDAIFHSSRTRTAECPAGRPAWARSAARFLARSQSPCTPSELARCAR